MRVAAKSRQTVRWKGVIAIVESPLLAGTLAGRRIARCSRAFGASRPRHPIEVAAEEPQALISIVIDQPPHGVRDV